LQTLEVHPKRENATPNRRSFVRFMAVRALLLGYSRAQVYELCARTDRMVRLWMELFNRGGIDVLRTQKPGHRPRTMKLERVRGLLVPVLENPAHAGVVHWTGVKVHGISRYNSA
jgi:transposase